MKMAIKDSKLNIDDINYINAHGTSTPQGDEIEFNSVSEIFGKSKEKLFMSSTKSSTGHLLGASGAVESIFSILAIKIILFHQHKFRKSIYSIKKINLVPTKFE